MLLNELEYIEVEAITGFVNDNVFCKVSKEVEYILNANGGNKPYSWDNVSNLEVDNSTEIEEWENEIDFYEGCIEEAENEEYNTMISEYKNRIDDIEDTIRELKSENGDIREVAEWWKVSTLLADKLEEWGEVVIRGYNIWGRLNKGGEITNEDSIRYICKELKLY